MKSKCDQVSVDIIVSMIVSMFKFKTEYTHAEITRSIHADSILKTHINVFVRMDVIP